MKLFDQFFQVLHRCKAALLERKYKALVGALLQTYKEIIVALEGHPENWFFREGILVNILGGPGDSKSLSVIAQMFPGISIETVRERFRGIYQYESHLQQCCKGLGELGRALDFLFFDPAIRAHFLHREFFRPRELESMAWQTIGDLWREPVALDDVCHLYNFNSDVEFDFSNQFHKFKIIRRKSSFAVRLLGKQMADHYFELTRGDYFLVLCRDTSETLGNMDDWDKFCERGTRRDDIMTALRLFRDGVVEADWQVSCFSPSWIHEVRGIPKYAFGRPRKEEQEYAYKIRGDEGRQFLSFAKNITKDLRDLGRSDTTLNKKLLNGLHFLEKSHEPVAPGDQIRELTTSLDCLLGGNARRNSTLVSFLLDVKDGDEREALYEFVHAHYVARHRWVHHGKPLDKEVNIVEFRRVVRLTFLAILTLYMRGHKDKKSLELKLAPARCRGVSGKSLSKEANYVSYLRENKRISKSFRMALEAPMTRPPFWRPPLTYEQFQQMSRNRGAKKQEGN